MTFHSQGQSWLFEGEGGWGHLLLLRWHSTKVPPREYIYWVCWEGHMYIRVHSKKLGSASERWQEANSICHFYIFEQN